MKRVLLIAVAVAVVMAISVPAWAGPNPNALFTLHAKAYTTKGKCTTASPNNPPAIPCTNYNTSWQTGLASDVYLVVAGGDSLAGLAGISCGIKYDEAIGVGLDVFSWSLCADLEFTNGGVNGEWPHSGGGNRITWVSDTNCQQTVAGTMGVHAVAGAFYVYAYSSDILQLTENANLEIPELAVASCAASTDYLPWRRVAFAYFSPGATGQGCNPCNMPLWECPEGVAVEKSTWGRIKTSFGSN